MWISRSFDPFDLLVFPFLLFSAWAEWVVGCGGVYLFILYFIFCCNLYGFLGWFLLLGRFWRVLVEVFELCVLGVMCFCLF